MKKSKMKIGFKIIIATVHAMMILSSCGNSEKKQTHDSREGDNVDHNHEHGEHSQLMNETREWLKKELGEKYNEPVSNATTAQLEQGKEIFTKHCASCHGSIGKGDGPAGTALIPKPANFTDPIHATFYSDQGRIYVIKKGIKGTAMVGWENALKEEEIHFVYAYINSLKNSGETMEHHEHSH